MDSRTDIRTGMTTRSMDGEKLGKIVAMDEWGFTVEKGLFFKKDYIIRYDEILDIQGDEVQLTSQANQIQEGREGEPGAQETEETQGASPPTAAATAPAPVQATRISEETRVPVTEEQIEITKQRRPAGEVHLRKDVVTETKQIQVPVTREEVRVERVPASAGTPAQPGEAALREEDITIPVMEEEIEIHKRPVVKEEVRVTKESYQEQRTATAETQHEEVHVQTTGRVRQTDENDPTKRRT